VIGIEEGMCCDEHWGLYLTTESLNTVSGTMYYTVADNIIKKRSKRESYLILIIG